MLYVGTLHSRSSAAVSAPQHPAYSGTNSVIIQYVVSVPCRCVEEQWKLQNDSCIVHGKSSCCHTHRGYIVSTGGNALRQLVGRIVLKEPAKCAVAVKIAIGGQPGIH
jgi:hypothetical protein